jgi:hypothetical protein
MRGLPPPRVVSISLDVRKIRYCAASFCYCADQAPRAMNETGAAEYEALRAAGALSMKLPSGRYSLLVPFALEQV